MKKLVLLLLLTFTGLTASADPQNSLSYDEIEKRSKVGLLSTDESDWSVINVKEIKVSISDIYGKNTPVTICLSFETHGGERLDKSYNRKRCRSGYTRSDLLSNATVHDIKSSYIKEDKGIKAESHKNIFVEAYTHVETLKFSVTLNVLKSGKIRCFDKKCVESN